MNESLRQAIRANAIEVLEESLHQTFGPNTAAAMQSWLILVSGLTNYPLAGGISGRSSAGKSFTAERVAELMLPGTVAFASRISVAGLFAMPRVHALVTDELVADEAFRKIRRQLITKGWAEQWLASPSGESRHQVLQGPIAVLDTSLVDQEAEFEDRNRMIVCQLDDSEQQIHHNAIMVVQRYSAVGRKRKQQWNNLRDTVRAHLSEVNLDAVVEIPDVLNLIRGETRIDAPRRLDLLCRVCSVIAILRQFSRRSSGGILYAEQADIDSALDLLSRARVTNDQETLPQYVARFFSILQQLDFGQDGLDLEQMQMRLNVAHFKELATDPAYSPSIPRPNQHWTQRMISYRLKVLLDNGLVTHGKSSRPIKWKLTTGAKGYRPVGVFQRIEQLRTRSDA